VLLSEHPFPQSCREVHPRAAADMSIDGRWVPRPGTPTPAVDSAASLALLAPCGFCWAEPGTPCTDAGQHYARYLRIYRRGILDAAGLAAVSKAAPYITAGAIIPETSNPAAGLRERP
jgi:hypothetical protein